MYIIYWPIKLVAGTYFNFFTAYLSARRFSCYDVGLLTLKFKIIKLVLLLSLSHTNCYILKITIILFNLGYVNDG